MVALQVEQGRTTSSPQVSVIIPARNEEASLGACLSSIVAQTGVVTEVTVVDDGSTDRTPQIARSFPGVRLLPAAPLREGCTGKCNALVAGAEHACGKWLLFTDADTVHLPGSLAHSLQEAEEHQAALLSYSPEQEVHGFWEKALMPLVFSELATTFRPPDVNDPASPVAAANGQYLLISRQAYDRVGGFGAVIHSLLEDVELARLVKRSGGRLWFRFGGDAVRTRMYRSFGQMVEGWTKNLALLFVSPVWLALKRAAEFLLITGAVVVGAVAALRGTGLLALAVAAIGATAYAIFMRRVRRAHFPWNANLLAIFGLPLYVLLLLRSRLSHIRGRVTWKGRTYGADRSQPGNAAPARIAQET
jgi:hypothetical protein